MDKRLEFALKIGVPIAVGAYYLFVFRNRKPSISFPEIDWSRRKGKVRFGNTIMDFNNVGTFSTSAGFLFNAEMYSMTKTTDGSSVFFTILKQGKPVERITVDFLGKLQYSQDL
jgi:hypothetical protein